MPTTMRAIGVVADDTYPRVRSTKSGSFQPVNPQALPAIMANTTGFLNTFSIGRPILFQSNFPSAFPNSTLAMAVVHKRRTLKIISKLMVGMASSPRLTLRIGTPNCTLLPKIAAMPKMVLPVLSNPKKRPAVRPRQ